MASLYRRPAGAGFGNGQAESARAKPLKRPSQRRAKFTVQAIYEAFVRIWQRGGAQAATTRAVALEAGCSVGTLYEYFPNKEALLSGYVRHTIEVLLDAHPERGDQPCRHPVGRPRASSREAQLRRSGARSAVL